MKKLLLILFLLSFQTAHAIEMLFHAALQKGMITANAKGKGGYNGVCLEVEVTNRTGYPLSIKLAPGTIFQSENEDLQDLMVTQEQLLALKPKSNAMLTLSTMCIQSHNGSPYMGALFSFLKIAEGDLKKMADLIAKEGYSGNSTAQSAVWAITNGASIREIYGSDTSIVRVLAEQVSQSLNISMSSFDFTPRRHQILSLNGSMESLIKTSMPNTSLKAYRSDTGEMVREIFRGYTVKPGFHQFRFGIHHSLGDSIPFILKLEDAEGNVIDEKAIGYHDQIPEMRKMNQEQFITFDLEKPIRGKVGIYDEEDNLYILMFDNKEMRQGFHKIHFIEGRDLPADKQYLIKVKDMEGNTVVADPLVSVDTPTKKFRPMAKRGVLRFNLKENITNARLDIYDSHGRKIWVVFENSRLRAGNKQIPYLFQHRQGPDATFTWKLIDGNGKLLEEHPIR